MAQDQLEIAVVIYDEMIKAWSVDNKNPQQKTSNRLWRKNPLDLVSTKPFRDS